MADDTLRDSLARRGQEDRANLIHLSRASRSDTRSRSGDHTYDPLHKVRFSSMTSRGIRGQWTGGFSTSPLGMCGNVAPSSNSFPLMVARTEPPKGRRFIVCRRGTRTPGKHKEKNHTHY
jgi:hypothetical protein